ncbi:MAG TPA: class I SAM-dependent methyltransferase [Candidatus Saccharimonadales bacterium]|nr:class I SAM-dependent methyltransferase [Candidatus Saccharimonadales bacterium]
MRESTPGHWDRYWKAHAVVEETYDNGDRMIRELLREPPAGKRALEVGAGSGRDSIELARAGARVFVVDYVRSSLEVCRRLSREAGVELLCIQADATRMPVREGSFDLVFHQGVLEHFRRPAELLDENYRILRPGGVALVDVPQTYHVYTLLKKLLIAVNRWFAGWETQYSAGSLTRVAERSGFRVEAAFGDWMVPGLFYRGLRYVLRQLRIARLPLYPGRGGRWDRWMSGLRERLRGRRWALNTMMCVGVRARKPAVPSP